MRSTAARVADVGNGVVCASFSADGSWLSIGTTDPAVGFVELSGMPPFAATSRSDVAVVREYRRLMSDVASAFIRVRGAVPGQRTAVGSAVTQQYDVAGDGRTVVEFRGRLDRPAYAEVTDVSPLDPLDLAVEPSAAGHRLVLAARSGAVGASVDVTIDGAPAGNWTTPTPTRELGSLASASLELPAGLGATATVTVALAGPRTTAAASGVNAADDAVDPVVASAWLVVPDISRPSMLTITRAAWRYILGCTALSTGDGETTILTDHRVLPLSWTRDAYYQARALLAGRVGVDRVGGHLRWLWLRCERPDELWQRSHQANGRIKDRAVQADQQLYPILELLDHRDVTGRWPGPEPPPQWGRLVEATWDALPRDAGSGLLRSEENPADDRAELPLLLSTAVLHWATAARLAGLASELALERRAEELAAEAEDVRTAVIDGFTVEGPFGRQWAYAIDGYGGARRYHDANDLPIALAPSFGFVDADDPTWNATMEFAFSTHNAAFVDGPGGGLGSLHTPGVWPLGDIQEWVWASRRGDEARVERVLGALAAVQRDGMLPETYDAGTAAWLSRDWFAWPGATVAALVTGGFG